MRKENSLLMTTSFDFPILERKVNYDEIILLTETLSKTETSNILFLDFVQLSKKIVVILWTTISLL